MTTWTVETLNQDVDDELESLAFDMRGRFVRVANLIKEFGPFKVGMPISAAWVTNFGRSGLVAGPESAEEFT